MTNSTNHQTGPSSPARPPRRWGRIVLFVSLAVNFAVLGIVGGAVFGRFGPGHDALAARDVGFGLFTEALGEQDRKDLRRAYGKARPDIRDERRQMRADLTGVLELVRAEPFDADALLASLNAGTARVMERQALGQTIIVEHLAKMTPENRADFAGRLEQTLKRRHHKRRGPKRD